MCPLRGTTGGSRCPYDMENLLGPDGGTTRAGRVLKVGLLALNAPGITLPRWSLAVYGEERICGEINPLREHAHQPRRSA